MIDFAAVERNALDDYLPRLGAQGYRVVRRPTKSDLPAFLADYEADAVAIGPKGNIVVEVVTKGSPTAQAKIRRLREILADHPDWRLEVVYGGQGERQVPIASMSAIERTVDALNKLTDPRASILLAWASLEAIARHLEPSETLKPQTPGRVVELLAAGGFVTPSQAETLRNLATIRNQVIHGNVDLEPSVDQLQSLITITHELVSFLKGRRA
ncbi:hypothetical protein [Rhizobium leguminosarum]|uniref:hypothetical protein n=1 Tax=Rhizobium leguminosarum TaxID=384 RepID=UPI001C94760F|nr:hypothetical protein [Rhizobium leguminosarum]MBY5794390.1 hypothetical protein [Rhizobium leguminosarum]